jgi:hypothetical protein
MDGDNGFFVMGVEKAFTLLHHRPDLELRMIYLDKNGNIRDSSSAGFKNFYINKKLVYPSA